MRIHCAICTKRWTCVHCAIRRKYSAIFVQSDGTIQSKFIQRFVNFWKNFKTIRLIVRQFKCKIFVNFLRYPLTSKNFFLNQKKTHRAIYKVTNSYLITGYLFKIYPHIRFFQSTQYRRGSFRPSPYERFIWTSPASNMTHLPIGLIPIPSKWTHMKISDMHTMHFPRNCGQ